jgi:hypothetical protein
VAPSAPPTAGAPPLAARPLDPYLERLRLWCAESRGRDSDAPGQISAGQRSLTLDAWEREQLARSFEPGTVDSDGSRLVARAVALRVKSMVDCEHLAAGDGQDGSSLYTLQGRLNLDCSLGMELLREMQRAIDELVVSGEAAHAERLRHSLDGLRRCLAEVKFEIAEAGRRAAQDASWIPRIESPEPAPAAWARPAAGAAPAAPAPSFGPPSAAAVSASVPLPRRRRRRLGRTGILILALAASVLLRLAVAGRNAGGGPVEPAAPTLPRAEAIRSTLARAPSLFVELHAAAWEALSESQRRALVEELGQAARSGDWAGVHLTTDEGGAVARWLRERGAELIPASETPSPPRPAAAR